MICLWYGELRGAWTAFGEGNSYGEGLGAAVEGVWGVWGDGGWVLYYTEVLLIVIPNFWDSPMIV